jgi:two-component system chemotaxis response regulator CheB
MDGRETLVRIRRRWPKVPVIMFSAVSERGAAATFDAMASGAKDFVTKPSMAGSPANALANVHANLVPVVRAWGERTRRRAAAAALAETESTRSDLRPAAKSSMAPRVPSPVVLRRPLTAPGQVAAVVIASSTGGPNALSEVIPHIPGDIGVPLFLVQHMPPTFTRHLAQRLNANSALTVVEAEPGLVAQPNHLYVAQGGRHMVVVRRHNDIVVELNDGPPENSCRPAADVLFRSAVAIWQGHLLSVVMTGMGQDGLVGSQAIADAGGAVIAQNEETSVVWGMPGAVTKAGLASEVLPLKELAAAVARRVNKKGGLAR